MSRGEVFHPLRPRFFCVCFLVVVDLLLEPFLAPLLPLLVDEPEASFVFVGPTSGAAVFALTSALTGIAGPGTVGSG